jgi:uncharacterized protein with PQ loop repeat
VTAVLALVASAVFLARLLPQPVRSLRTGRLQGVSALAPLNAAVADAAWMVYGFDRHLPVVWAVSLPAFVISAATAFVLRRQIRVFDVVLATGWAAVVALAAGAGATLLTPILAATVVVCCGPAVWAAYRSAAPDGISPLTWGLAVADGTSWGLYGVVVHSPALELYAVVMIATAAAMLQRVSGSGRQAELAGDQHALHL